MSPHEPAEPSPGPWQHRTFEPAGFECTALHCHPTGGLKHGRLRDYELRLNYDVDEFDETLASLDTHQLETSERSVVSQQVEP